MRSPFLALILALLTIGIATSEGRIARAAPIKLGSLNPPSTHAKRLTNAQRLARGLHVAPPAVRSPGGRRIAGRAGPSTTPTVTSTPVLPTSSAATSTDTPTSSPPMYTGMLQVTGEQYTGYYVSAQGNGFGEYLVTDDAAQALRVRYTSPSPSSSSPSAAVGPLSIETLNGYDAEGFPYLGGILGFANTGSDLSAVSANYAYLGGTTESGAGAPPASGGNSYTSATGLADDWESTIWTVDGGTGAVVPQWVNPDGSMVQVSVVINGGILVLTGDPAGFVGRFGSSPIVTLSFVQDPTAVSTE